MCFADDFGKLKKHVMDVAMKHLMKSGKNKKTHSEL